MHGINDRTMPYYCTVPRCTSMAGKVANVSFHQFPRDTALADHWNRILKRGKPYTKYSKVCSLHFTPADYTITSVGKNKGQWRTLRKDAVPSRNLPDESPAPNRTPRASRGDSDDSSEQQIHQQLAHAVYVQTMLAVHAASVAAAQSSIAGTSDPSPNISDSEQADERTVSPAVAHREPQIDNENANVKDKPNSYKCDLCSKCFKDPDVFVLHKRWHSTHDGSREQEILNKMAQHNSEEVRTLSSPIDPLNLEHHILLAMRMNMQNYIKTALSGHVEDVERQNSDVQKRMES